MAKDRISDLLIVAEDFSARDTALNLRVEVRELCLGDRDRAFEVHQAERFDDRRWQVGDRDLGGDVLDRLGIAKGDLFVAEGVDECKGCLLYTSPSPRDQRGSRMPSSA